MSNEYETPTIDSPPKANPYDLPLFDMCAGDYDTLLPEVRVAFFEGVTVDSLEGL